MLNKGVFMLRANKVCLVRPFISKNEESGIPLNILILASCLENEGYNIVIKDYDYLKNTNFFNFNLEDYNFKIAMDILKTQCKYILITAMCSNFSQVMSIASLIKKYDMSRKIIIGGPHSTMCYEEVIKEYSSIDFIIIGEGEITTKELLNCLEDNGDLRSVDGICYMDDKDIIITPKRELLKDLDDSPIPAYHLINLREYYKRKGIIPIYIGSGCPYNCNFCTTSLVWERKYRTKSIQRIIKEITELYFNYQINNFDFIHDNLTSNNKFINELLENIIKIKINKNININFRYSSRIDTINEILINKSALAGCTSIFFGIESGSENIQRLIGKNLKITEVIKILSSCIRHDILPQTSFILGFPEETIKELEKTINLAFWCKVCTNELVSFNILSVYPGSYLYEKHLNELYLDENNLEVSMSSFLNSNDIIEIKSKIKIYSSYYYFKKLKSGLSYPELLKLCDFISLVIELYPYLFNTLLNVLNISIIDLYYFFKNSIEKLTLEELDNLSYNIDNKTIEKLISKFNLEENRANIM